MPRVAVQASARSGCVVHGRPVARPRHRRPPTPSASFSQTLSMHSKSCPHVRADGNQRRRERRVALGNALTGVRIEVSVVAVARADRSEAGVDLHLIELRPPRVLGVLHRLQVGPEVRRRSSSRTPPRSCPRRCSPSACPACSTCRPAEQMAFEKSVAVFSIGMPLTPPHPASTAASTEPVRTLFVVVMSAPGCNSRPSRGNAANSCDSGHAPRQRFANAVQSLTVRAGKSGRDSGPGP